MAATEEIKLTLFLAGHPMRSDDLTPDQARALKNRLQPMLSYLNRLKHRMRQKGFPPDDRLLTAVCRAEDSLHALTVEVITSRAREVPGNGDNQAGTLRPSNSARQPLNVNAYRANVMTTTAGRRFGAGSSASP